MSRVWKQFDQTYESEPAYFGDRPSRALLDAVPDDGTGQSALDLGSGPGRNAIALAQRGYDVTAVDRSAAALRNLRDRASEEGLSVRTEHRDIRRVTFEPASFDLIAAVTVLGHVEKSRLPDMTHRIISWLRPGGLLFTEEFNTADPGCVGAKSASECAHLVRHYFDTDELIDLFHPLEIVICSRLQVEDRAHGRPHSHNIVRMVAQKP